MKAKRTCFLFIFSSLLLNSCSKSPEPLDIADLYLIHEYSETRDPEVDLAMAVETVSKSNRHILMEVGGEWCVWCHILDDFISTHHEVAEALTENFVVIKVNYSDENENEAFLSRFPEIPGYPHFFVLDQHGKFIHSQGTLELEDGDSYSTEVFLSFIEQWGP